VDDRIAGVDRRLFGVAAALIAVLVIAGVTVLAALTVLRGPETPLALPPAEPTAGGTPAAATSTLLRAIELRSGPSSEVAIIARLEAGAALRVVGRSADSRWLVVSPEANPAQVGWVPASVVGDVDVSRLAVIAPSGGAGTPPPGGPTLTPDLPDLRIEQVFARDNRLFVEIANHGAGDATDPILVAVNEAVPVPLDVRPGEPLRAGDRFEAAVPGLFVQLRAPVTVRVLLLGGSQETAEGKEWSDLVGPDVPNDLEVRSAAAHATEGHLLVVLGNNSPIPIVGSVTVSVREAPPSNLLLARETREVALSARGTLDFGFPELRDFDLTRLVIRLSTDAIEDAVIANNTYPR
jgi:hypothetical protein